MAAGVQVFGRPATSSIASKVLSSPSLLTTPSPSVPEQAPAGDLAKNYATLYAIAAKTLTLETDEERKRGLERTMADAETALQALASSVASVGAPVPNVPPAPMPQAAPRPPVGAPPAAPLPPGGAAPAPPGLPA